MTSAPIQKTARAGDGTRAARLLREAGNCVSIAVQGRDVRDVGQLIDEAIKLARRSRELGQG